MTKNKYFFPLIMVTSLFFMWGFVHNLDPALIPHLKRSFSLSNLQASLVDSAVFIAYFIMALPAGYLMKRFGYKAGIITGLLLFAFGSFLFIPAADTQLYVFFLGALFIIACGLTILETAANPYVSLLGDPATSTRRLNFAQSFNGLAATLAPVVGGQIIMTEVYSDEALSKMTEDARQIALASEASSVKIPYFLLGSVILIVAIIFYFTTLPEIEESDEKTDSKTVLQALRHRHLSWAVAAQFFYVGAQVCVFSFSVLYAIDVGGLDKEVARYYSGFGCGLAFMTGRFIGVYFMKFVLPERLLAIYATACILLSLLAINVSGILAVYTIIGIAFFMSIMFPTIFSFGIKGLGRDTKFGSSLIIMSIVGGAIIPPIFGYLSDISGNIRYGYIACVACFAVVLIFALSGHKIVKPKAV